MKEYDGYVEELMCYVKPEHKAVAETTIQIIIAMAERDQIKKTLEDIKKS